MSKTIPPEIDKIKLIYEMDKTRFYGKYDTICANIILLIKFSGIHEKINERAKLRWEWKMNPFSVKRQNGPSTNKPLLPEICNRVKN